jgi:hypothetical protein
VKLRNCSEDFTVTGLQRRDENGEWEVVRTATGCSKRFITEPFWENPVIPNRKPEAESRKPSPPALPSIPAK